MPIDEISDLRHYPRLGRIRLGIKKVGQRGPYPAATDYFVCPEEVAAIYGERPTELPIMFPANDLELVAPQWYKCYSYSQGLICKGNGKTCKRKVDVDTGDFANRDTKKWDLAEGICDPHECPMVEPKQCRRMMSLLFILPEVPGLGVYQLDTSSFYSIVNINSQLAAGDPTRNVPEGFLRQFTRGRIAFIPLILSIGPQVVTPPGEGRKTVHVLSVRANVKLVDLIRISGQAPRQVLLPTLQEEEPPDDLYPGEVIGSEAAESEEPAAVVLEPEAPPTATAEARKRPSGGRAAAGEQKAPAQAASTAASGGVTRGGFGATYDSKKGSDKTGDGSTAKPFKTKARAQAEVDRRSGEAGKAAGEAGQGGELPLNETATTATGEPVSGTPTPDAAAERYFTPPDKTCTCPLPLEPGSWYEKEDGTCWHAECGGYICTPPIDCFPGCPHMPLQDGKTTGEIDQTVDQQGEAGGGAPLQGDEREESTMPAAETAEAKPLVLGEGGIGESELSSPIESPKSAAERAPGESPLNIDLDWIKETMQFLKWTEDTAKTWIASHLQVNTDGSLLDVLQRLTYNQADQFTRELNNRVGKRQPGLFNNK